MTHIPQHNRRKLKVVESPQVEPSNARFKDLPEATKRRFANISMIAMAGIVGGTLAVSGLIDGSNDRANKRQLSERQKAVLQANKYVKAVAKLGLVETVKLPAGAGEGYAVDTANDSASLNEITQSAAEKFVRDEAPGEVLIANQAVEVPRFPFDKETGKLQAVVTDKGIKINPPKQPG